MVYRERGLLIQGRPQSGKSTLTLALIKHGASLVSDDVVMLHSNSLALTGTHSGALRGMVMMDGSLIDVTQQFGEDAVKKTAKIDLSFQLSPPDFLLHSPNDDHTILPVSLCGHMFPVVLLPSMDTQSQLSIIDSKLSRLPVSA